MYIYMYCVWMCNHMCDNIIYTCMRGFLGRFMCKCYTAMHVFDNLLFCYFAFGIIISVFVHVCMYRHV